MLKIVKGIGIGNRTQFKDTDAEGQFHRRCIDGALYQKVRH